MNSKMVSLQQNYQSQLQEIGVVLQKARKDRDITIDSVAEQILIRASLLRAIEQGSLEQLPEPVYIRGLIRRYGDFLGLDGEALAIQFFTPIETTHRSFWKNLAAAQLRPLHLYLVYIILMIAAISGLSYLLQRSTPEVAILPPLDPQISQEPSSSPERSAGGDTSFNSTESNGSVESEGYPIQVDMTLTAQSWLRVVSDGETKFEGILQQGDSRSWTADDSLTIRAGNAGGVIVSYNSGQSQPLGDPGMVAEVTYAPTESVTMAF